ncbi:MAG: hypothetical protein IJ493_03630 [Clostridia bacterium]|nr:hypothetical protein [Clostridia bacterium]
MNWSSVKNLLIAMLITANLLVLYNILAQNRSQGYIDEAEVKDAAALLAERGLLVDAAVIPLRRFDAVIYESRYGEDYDYYIRAALIMTGCDVEMHNWMPSGSYRVTLKDGSAVEFDGEFGFVFSSADFQANTTGGASYTDVTVENFAQMSRNGQELGSARMQNLTAIALKALEPEDTASDDAVLDAQVTAGYHDPVSGLSYLHVRQTADGWRIFNHEVVCVFEGDRLMQIKGHWYFAGLHASYDEELYDQVNILFSDLKTIKNGELTDAQGSVMETPVRVTSMSACYSLFWDAEKTVLYFIPAWQIDHESGATVVYNAANSTIYWRSE